MTCPVSNGTPVRSPEYFMVPFSDLTASLGQGPVPSSGRSSEQVLSPRSHGGVFRGRLSVSLPRPPPGAGPASVTRRQVGHGELSREGRHGEGWRLWRTDIPSYLR